MTANSTGPVERNDIIAGIGVIAVYPVDQF
jgi:hypothetical protein